LDSTPDKKEYDNGISFQVCRLFTPLVLSGFAGVATLLALFFSSNLPLHIFSILRRYENTFNGDGNKSSEDTDLDDVDDDASPGSFEELFEEGFRPPCWRFNVDGLEL
jgi:hypothetical protein